MVTGVVVPVECNADEPAMVYSRSSSSVAIRRILPFFSGTRFDGDVAPTPTLVSSRKLHAGNCRGEDGRASDTLLCCLCGDKEELEEESEGRGKGAVNEKVDVDGILARGVTVVVVMASVASETTK